MLTTDSADLDAQVRRWRQHSMSVSDAVRATSATVVFEEYPDLGYNYRMTDIQAAVGRAQLARLEEFTRCRRELGGHYVERLSRIGGLGLPVEPPYARTNWQSFCIRLPDRLDQRTVMQQMLEAGIATRRGVMNAHREKAYPPGTWSCGYEGCGNAGCPHLRQSELAQEHCILLPMFSQMSTQQVDCVVAALEQACQ
jgi:perosamine synthetase